MEIVSPESEVYACHYTSSTLVPSHITFSGSRWSKKLLMPVSNVSAHHNALFACRQIGNLKHAKTKNVD